MIYILSVLTQLLCAPICAGRLNYYPRFFMDFQLRLLIFFYPFSSASAATLISRLHFIFRC